MISKRVLSLTVLIVLAAGSAVSITGQIPPQQPPPSSQPPPTGAQDPQQTPPTFRAGINFVRVDVIVSDNKTGSPVPDLQQTDFEVTEDGKPQKIESFKLIRITGNPEPGGPSPREIRTEYDEESEAARDDVRLFAVFLDDYHVRRGASLSVRAPLQRFLTSQLGAADMVGLMYPLTPLSDLRLSRNHDAIAKAVGSFMGRKYDYTPRNQIEEKYAMYPASTVERIRNDVTMSALKGLVTHLGSLREGRKAVILVSEGFTNILPPQLRSPIASMPGLGNPARGNPFAGEGDPNEERAAFFADTELQADLREIYDTANRNNTAIYALDPRGLATNEFDINESVGLQTDQKMLNSTMNTLRELADQTDGRAIVNQNDLNKGLSQIVRDSSAYYLIGYNSSQAPTDGRFHEIKVRVKRSGVQVRSRKGYWAMTAAETARATAPPKPGPPSAVEHALASIETSQRSRTIRTWLGMRRGENGKTRVTLVWEPVPSLPGAHQDPPARVSVIAASADGSAYFRGRVPDVALASAAPGSINPERAATAATSGSKVMFEAAPGQMQLRLSVEGANAQVLDTDIREVAVPDLTAPQVSMSTPEVFRARTPRELQALSTDPSALPTAGREFTRTDRVLIRFEIYGAGADRPVVSARLLSRSGQQMAPLTPTVLSGNAAQIDLPLASLAPGEYLVEIKAKGEGGESTELVPVRVTG